ncbi:MULTISPECIES: hypothetical protein [Arthrobacter]|uniref:Uncharacterized protein n=2 Tax=Arthrobacter TaxID=1663 RepID=A0ABU9KL53_9MICC|nr:hypothetical protein [Arthrobacter sp. YJM1]MDP5226855.1 hypothetical protein [Arthrobacter sp. YJM1]
MKQFPNEVLVFQQQSRRKNQESGGRSLEKTRDDVFVQLHLMNAIR